MTEFFYMTKMIKKIAAMGAAVMMMSSMAIGASAANSYNLHYTKGARHQITFVRNGCMV